MNATTKTNGLDVTAVHPRNGAKYSPNLHRWLSMRNRKHHAWTSRVYHDNSGILWIGMLDLGDLIGARLMNVLCYGAKAESCCWVNLRGLVEVADFWARYVRDGRCAIDTEHERHFVGDDTRWTVSGETRTCLWCGRAQQVLARWTETVDHQEWLPVTPNVGVQRLPKAVRCNDGLGVTSRSETQGTVPKTSRRIDTICTCALGQEPGTASVWPPNK